METFTGEVEGRSRTFYVIASIAAVLIVAALAYFAFSIYKGRQITKTAPTGSFILTLRPGGANATTSVYFYNLDSKVLTFVNDRNSFNITGEGMPSGIAVTSSNFFSAVGTPEENIPQLYKIDMKNNFTKTKITDSQTFLKRHPEFSPDGKQIAFMAQQKFINNATTAPDDWSIYVTDLSGKETLLGPGAYPQWGPDSNKLLAMRSDGLYLYDLVKHSSTNVWKMTGGQAVLRMNIDVSRDGLNLAWSVPKNNEVILAKISSWEPFTFKIYKTINNVSAFWPVFSPDANYLATIISNKDNAGVAHPFVEVYDTDTLQSQKVLDLNGFSASSMSLTDWGINI